MPTGARLLGPRRYYTQKDYDLFQDLYDRGMTDEEIVRHLDCSLYAIQKFRSRRNLPPQTAKRKVVKKLSPLAEAAMKARLLGMTYGQYMVSHNSERKVEAV